MWVQLAMTVIPTQLADEQLHHLSRPSLRPEIVAPSPPSQWTLHFIHTMTQLYKFANGDSMVLCLQGSLPRHRSFRSHKGIECLQMFFIINLTWCGAMPALNLCHWFRTWRAIKYCNAIISVSTVTMQKETIYSGEPQNSSTMNAYTTCVCIKQEK